MKPVMIIFRSDHEKDRKEALKLVKEFVLASGYTLLKESDKGSITVTKDA